ncbi:TerC family protein [Candidatus Marinimicrobia bacterium MT.SAG.3]|nr:TerC family protein [Candidatus Marinimicrobia bacterium MT.SAG.3]
MTHGLSWWVGFNILILALIAIDLGLLHKKSHVISVKEALIWSAGWILISLTFNVGVYFWFGYDSALQFLTGYLIEKSLSVDNIFVFAILFSYFKVKPEYQHKVLMWGILGALVMRGALIAIGTALITNFHWIIFILGAFLVYTGIKMAVQKEISVHPEKNPIVNLVKKFIPISDDYDGDKFVTTVNGKKTFTPLLVVLLVVEVTDLMFAVDSIPAIFAITTDAFIVYTSNVFAILGLRALYFALSGVLDMFHYLKYGLGMVLSFVGTKMLISEFYIIPIPVALGTVAAILAISIVVSIVIPAKTVTNEG